jgi:hypothetical protein
MRIIVDVNHPAQVHCFKNFVREMKGRGHEVLVTATEKEVSLKLLDSFGYDYVNLGSYGNNLVMKLLNIPVIDIKMYLAVRKFRPDIFIGLGTIRGAHVSFIMRRNCIVLEDTECSRDQIMLYLPFVKDVLTTSNFKMDLGKKQIKLNTFKELAYLHPDHFRPDPSVLEAVGLKPGERFIVVRFISWGASHDVGYHGIEDRKAVVMELEKYGRVFVSSENDLEPELLKYRITLPPDKLHDLLYYAALYFGEGGTTASEAALLGTHAILIDPEAKQCGVFYDLHSYGLLSFFDRTEDGMAAAKKLLEDPGLVASGKEKRMKLASEKLDLTKFLEWFVENYPGSADMTKNDPAVQKRFMGVEVANHPVPP